MNTHEIPISSKITELTIFSGGGGIIKRNAVVSLEQGMSLVKLDGIPVSFDPETLQINISPTDENSILQFTTKMPTKKYIVEQLGQEATAAHNVINASANIGKRRNDIIKVAEDVVKRDFLDEYSEIGVFIECNQPADINIEFSFIIEDSRLNWSPFITIDLLENDEAKISCLLTINNQTATTYENIKVNFAEFELPSISNDDESYKDYFNDVQRQEKVVTSRRQPGKKKWSKQVVQNRMLLK